MKKLYVGNLPFQASEQDLRDFFAQEGVQADSVALIRDNYTNQLRGFGFVEINDDDVAARAIDTLNGKDFLGRPIVVNEARPRREGGGRGGRGGGRGGRGGGFSRGRKGPRW